MDTEINVKVNYVGFTRRIAAEILDYIIFFLPLFILYIVVSDNHEVDNFYDEMKRLTSPYTIFTSMLYTVLEILMIQDWEVPQDSCYVVCMSRMQIHLKVLL